tara:strand:+ start:109 stop:339 length:231 start_codon:yes stop_codon:yes gene_type:complete
MDHLKPRLSLERFQTEDLDIRKSDIATYLSQRLFDQKEHIMRKLTEKIIDKRYSNYEFNYIKPCKVKLPGAHDCQA